MTKGKGQPQALVIAGDGINCENETAFALSTVGFAVTNKHVSEVLREPQSLKDKQILCLPGGFSFGDEIASGKVLAIKIRHHLQEELQEFMAAGNLLLAICNGFQVAVQLGLLPFPDKSDERIVSLVRNHKGRFLNRWVSMDVSESKATGVYFAGLKTISLPMRHGEGRIKLEAGSDGNGSENREQLVKDHAALRYTEDVNGSFDRIASLTNDSGTVMGLMPHPEAFVRWTQHPNWTKRKREILESRGDNGAAKVPVPDGLRIFQNAYNYVQNAL